MNLTSDTSHIANAWPMLWGLMALVLVLLIWRKIKKGKWK